LDFGHLKLFRASDLEIRNSRRLQVG